MTTELIDFLSLFRRVQINYSENNGKVLPGYLQGIGFIGTLDPSLALQWVARQILDMNLQEELVD